MTSDEIIEMARQAGFTVGYGSPALPKHEAFAKLVAAKEREEIAQFIDSTGIGTLPDSIKKHYARMLSFYSSQIRARGEA